MNMNLRDLFDLLYQAEREHNDSMWYYLMGIVNCRLYDLNKNRLLLEQELQDLTDNEQRIVDCWLCRL